MQNDDVSGCVGKERRGQMARFGVIATLDLAFGGFLGMLTRAVIIGDTTQMVVAALISTFLAAGRVVSGVPGNRQPTR